MKKVIFTALAVFAMVMSFANFQAHQQASLTDPNPNVIIPTQN